ncbi:MAG: Co2+/Mg2+ efflux protein ApaG [Pseudomonadota bacterium]
MYEAVTKGIRITVKPQFVEDQSTPDEGYFFWAYTVDIANESPEAVRLTARYWQITDSEGRSEEVRGPGVVGQTPHIPPGESFSYTSGCPLGTPSGIMVGSYEMATDDGDSFEAAIPAFSLDCDYAVRSVN